MWHLSLPLWHFLVRGAIIYIFVLFLIRVSGKREIGQMGAEEFVAILLVSNAVQNAMNGGDNSITGGLILSSVIIGFSMLFAFLSYKSRFMEELIKGEPTAVIRDGKLVARNIRREFLSPTEIQSALDAQGVNDIHDVELAVLESDGKIVVRKKAIR